MATVFVRAGQTYARALEMHPMVTQSLTSGILYMCGDAVAQRVERHLHIESPGKVEYNWARTARMGFFGAAVGGPLMCVWYKQLDRATTLYRLNFDPVLRHEGLNSLFERTPGLKWIASLHHARELPSVWTDVSAKLVADLVFFTPAFINVYLLVMGMLERKEWSQIRHKLTTQFHNAWGTCMMLWLPVQLINFRYVPVEYQGVVVGAANVVWKSILSFIMHFSEYNTDTYRELQTAQMDATELESIMRAKDERIQLLKEEVESLKRQLEGSTLGPHGAIQPRALAHQRNHSQNLSRSDSKPEASSPMESLRPVIFLRRRNLVLESRAMPIASIGSTFHPLELGLYG